MSKIEVNTVDVQCGSTLTLGSSGKTVTLATGASQSGFGRTGTVDWCTTAKTSPFTAVSGKGYMVNTCGGIITATLPSSPTAGDIVSLADYKSTWQTNNVTLGRGGSKINGGCFDSTLNTQGQSITMVYIDGTQGWKSVQDSTSDVTGAPDYISATGGTITTSGDYKIHTFNADACFAITSAPTPANNKVSYVVVGGGASGGGSAWAGGGGGAGGFREGKLSTDPYTASPAAATPCSALSVSVQTYPITVGAGGAAKTTSCNAGAPGSNSIFSTITSAGGGGGAWSNRPGVTALAGGSGGGGSGNHNPTCSQSNAAGAGNTPSQAPPQGNAGGPYSGGPVVSTYQGAGGGGGIGGVGGTGSTPAPTGSEGGDGGAGLASSITGSPVLRAGGGGGASDARGPGCAGAAGTGGGGVGARGGPDTAGSGTVNTGGGGGGGATGATPTTSDSGGGGSGVVIIRYKYQ
jgi:hypothetical protein